MKRILIVLVIIAFVLAYGRIGYYETHYTMDGLVIDVDNDLVTVVDLTCQEWQFYGEDFNVDDVVKLTFKNSGNSSRFDDEIEKAVKMDYAWED